MLDSRFSWAPLAGRVFLGTLFVVSGIRLATGGMDALGGLAGRIDDIGLPFALILAFCLMAIKLIGGIALIVGYYTRVAAVALGGFVALTIVLVHTDVQNDPHAFKNLAIVGGFLYVLAFGSGPYALDNRSRHLSEDASNARF